MSKNKRRSEAIFIPNQFAKNPSRGWFCSGNEKQDKVEDEEYKRRIKNALKAK